VKLSSQKGKPKPRPLNRAGWTYVLMHGLFALAACGAGIVWVLRHTHTTLAQQIHDPDGRGVMVPIVIAGVALSAMSSAARRAKGNRGLSGPPGSIMTGLADAAIDGAINLAVTGVSEATGDFAGGFGGAGSFGGGGAGGSW
jgi:hypothetical protein